jgi:hypothetical protein
MVDDVFEWDDVKAASNARKHTITFDMAREAFLDPSFLDWIDENQDFGEDRYGGIGMCEGRVLFFAFTMRGDRIRIVSARLVTPRERRMYHDGLEA